jgi:hypothetical protein
MGTPAKWDWLFWRVCFLVAPSTTERLPQDKTRDGGARLSQTSKTDEREAVKRASSGELCFHASSPHCGFLCLLVLSEVVHSDEHCSRSSQRSLATSFACLDRGGDKLASRKRGGAVRRPPASHFDGRQVKEGREDRGVDRKKGERRMGKGKTANEGRGPRVWAS